MKYFWNKWKSNIKGMSKEELEAELKRVNDELFKYNSQLAQFRGTGKHQKGQFSNSHGKKLKKQKAILLTKLRGFK